MQMVSLRFQGWGGGHWNSPTVPTPPLFHLTKSKQHLLPQREVELSLSPDFTRHMFSARVFHSSPQPSNCPPIQQSIRRLPLAGLVSHLQQKYCNLSSDF